MWVEGNNGIGGTGSFQFSTNETKTGLKWIDGKDIYAKTHTATNIDPRNFYFALPTGYENIIDWTAIIDVQGNNNNANNMYYNGPQNPEYFATWTESGYFHVASGWSGASGIHVTIYYTKT